MGIPLDLFTLIFAIARVTGWTAHVMEQHKNNRIIRPTDDYVGPMGLKVTPTRSGGESEREDRVMSSLNLNLSEDARAFIEKQVADGRFALAQARTWTLVRSDQTSLFDDATARGFEGLGSGDAVDADESYWTRSRTSLIERHSGSGGR